MIEKNTINFMSEDTMCAGWFFKTEKEEKAPCVILAHGFCGVKEMRLDAYAERFAEAGYHALVFDYRHFGGSDGKPRQLLDIRKQLQDWQSAIQFAKELPGVDADKLILWGTSFSGGHVLKTALKVDSIAAVISQVPHMNGFASAAMAGLRQNVRLGVASMIDLVKNLFNSSPFYVPAIGKPGELAAMTAPGESEAYLELIPEGHDPDQLSLSVAARVFFYIPYYSPGRLASKLSVPWLVQVALQDQTTPPSPAIKAAKKAQNAELITYDTGHFDVYVQPGFETTIKDQLSFLKKHVT